MPTTRTAMQLSPPAVIAIESHKSGELSLRAEWRGQDEGLMIISKIAYYERDGSLDRFVIHLPNGQLAEFDYSANLWLGFRPGQIPPPMPIAMMRSADRWLALGFSDPS